MGELSISAKNSNGRKVDSYLFWLRVRNILSASFFITIFATGLLTVMFYRFNGLHNNSFGSFEKAQDNSVLQKNKQI